MKVTTSRLLPAPLAEVWPLLTGSVMSRSGCFFMGFPRPVRCSLDSPTGAAGALRRCESNHGIIRQRITTWNPPELLQFEMLTNNHWWAPMVSKASEEFVLEPSSKGTRIRRTSDFTAAGGSCRLPLEAFLWFCFKRVHCYVFANWRHALSATSMPANTRKSN